MQAAYAARSLRVMMTHSIPSRCFTRIAPNPTRLLLQPHTRNLMLWSSARTTPYVLNRVNAFLSDSPSKTPQKPGSTANGHALFSTASQPEKPEKKVVASQEQTADTKIIATLAKYLWMKDNIEFRFRVIAALGLLIGAKVINVQVPFLFKLAVDWLATSTGTAGSLAEFTAANAYALAVFASPAAVLIGYGIARTGAAAFNGTFKEDLKSIARA